MHDCFHFRYCSWNHFESVTFSYIFSTDLQEVTYSLSLSGVLEVGSHFQKNHKLVIKFCSCFSYRPP